MRSEAASREQEWIDAFDTKRAKVLALKSRWIDPAALNRRQAWIDTIVRSAPTHAVTLIWNPEDGRLTPERVRADTAIAHCRVDRALMGRGFNKLPLDRRTGYVGLIEHPETNTHAHYAWRVPAEHQAGFEDALRGWWEHLHPYGDVDVQALYEPAGWAAYMVKDQWRAPRAEDAALLLKSHT
ncbi:hypothetical protein SR39_21045 [Methylobacterium radiotolerans]|nr:hypothetical protein SR39_21045 [Methylobacterium radiotolerans]